MYLLRLITTTKDSTTSGIFTYASNGSIFKKILHENMNDKSYIGFNYTKLIYIALNTHNAHNDQKFQREQKKSSPIFKCKTIISALFCHYIDVF